MTQFINRLPLNEILFKRGQKLRIEENFSEILKSVKLVWGLYITKNFVNS